MRIYANVVVSLTFLALPGAAQVARLSLNPLGTFEVIGGRVTGIDVAAAGKRLITLGEFDDAVIWSVDRRELARATIAACARSRYVALHPTRARAVVCVDCKEPDGADAVELTFLAAKASGNAGEPAVVHTHRRLGFVLALAWNVEGSLLAVGRVTRDDTKVDIFSEGRDCLVPLETITIPSLTAMLAGRTEVPKALRPFQQRWRYCETELARDQDMGGRVEFVREADLVRAIAERRMLAAERDELVDQEESGGGLLVADARARLARHLGGLGVGVDEIGQTFTRRDERLEVHAFNAGPALAIAFTPDGEYVGVASRAALTVARADGTRRRVLHGKHLLAPGVHADELLLLRHGLRHYRASSGAIEEGPLLPAAHADIGEEAPMVATMPQLRSFVPLNGEQLVVGGYSAFGHDAILVDPATKKTRLVADSDRDSRTRINVRQVARLRDSRWVAREVVKAISGPFRRVSVLRGFDGAKKVWVREFAAFLVALATAPAGTHLVVADEDGGLHLVDAETGTVVKARKAPRATLFVGYLDAHTLLGHDGVDLFLLDATTLAEMARAALPAGAPITATALSTDGKRLALGRLSRTFVYALVR